jgi:RNA recognition motif-containing protein
LGFIEARGVQKDIMKKIYVGNLPWSVTNEDLHELFAKHGEVHSARVITDRDTGRSRGFGFVEMDTENADKAIEALNGTDMDGRALRVNEAQDKRDNRKKRSW